MKKAIQFLGFIVAIALFTVACNNDPCKDVICGSHAVCTEGTCNCVAGYHKNTATGECELDNACDTVTCDTAHHEYCASGVCLCDSGYVRHNGVCVLPCDTITCNATTEICNNGVCDCATGYVRNAAGVCVTYREIYLGTWSATETCHGDATNGTYTSTAYITADASDPNKILIDSASYADNFRVDRISATVNMYSISIPSQAPNAGAPNVTLVGSGTRSVSYTPSTITMTYYAGTSSVRDTCTCTWTKQ